MNSGFAGSMGLIPGNTLTDQLTEGHRPSSRWQPLVACATLDNLPALSASCVYLFLDKRRRCPAAAASGFGRPTSTNNRQQ